MMSRSVGEEWGEQGKQGKCGSNFLLVLVDLWSMRGRGLQVATFHTCSTAMRQCPHLL